MRHPEMILFGEDVAAKGGVYGVTRGLRTRFGAGAGLQHAARRADDPRPRARRRAGGLVPIPEIQFLAYLHNAEDQLRGEAATLSFFSGGAVSQPMVVRIAGLGYQKGFGGHFHNDNASPCFATSPGWSSPRRRAADDAAAMLRTCVAAAQVDGTVCVFLEPIALYHTATSTRRVTGSWLAPSLRRSRADRLGTDSPCR